MNTLIEILGWTLLHFLWQGTLAAAVLWCALRILRSGNAKLRYALSGITLITMLAGVCVTGARLWNSATPETAVRAIENTSPVVSPANVAPGPKRERATATQPASPAPVSATVETSATEVPPASVSAEGPALQASFRPWLSWIVTAWALGVALLSARILRSWFAVRAVRSRATACDDDAMTTLLDRLRERLTPHRSVRLLTTMETAVPMVIGWLKPAIIVPAGLISRLPAWQLEAILAHELAHVGRHDYLVNLLQTFFETVFFYHPAVWWVSAQLRREREHCCDDIAAATCGGALDYARALTALEEARGHTPVLAVGATGGSLLARIRRLLGAPAREAGAVSSWPAGLALACLGLALLAGAHFAHGDAVPEDDSLPDAPEHEMATALVQRWQSLQDDQDAPIPEARVAVMRKAIASHLESGHPPEEQRKTLTKYQNWHSDREEHEATDLPRLMNAIAVVNPYLVQFAFNDTPRRGITASYDPARFGPPAPNGLRAAWWLEPEKETFVSGDMTFGVLTLWNTGKETLLVGNGFGPETPGLRPAPAFQGFGAEGRAIEVRAEAVDPVNFTAKWLLKPGETATYGGYRFKIGTGVEREATFKPMFSSEFALPDLRNGETVKLTATFPYPAATNDATALPRLETPAITFACLKPEAVKVWSTKQAGTWPMANGVILEVRGEVYHGADVQTTARLRWPDGRFEDIQVATDFFVNREPWAIAWDAGATSLWIATGEPIGPGSARPSAPVPARSIQRIEFSDPLRIGKSHYTAWPEEGAPSEACRAEMARYFVVEAGGKLTWRRFGWASAEPDNPSGNPMAISVFVGKDGSFRVDEEEVASAQDDREDAVRKLRAALREQAQNLRDHYPRLDPDPAFQPPPVVVSIFAVEEVPFKFVTEALEACKEGDTNYRVSLKRLNAGSAMRIPPTSRDEKFAHSWRIIHPYDPREMSPYIADEQSMRSQYAILDDIRQLSDIPPQTIPNSLFEDLSSWEIGKGLVAQVSTPPEGEIASGGTANKPGAADDPPSVRGVLLSDAQKSEDITAFDDLYEPDPVSPGEMRRKDGVFFMSLGTVGPWLYYPANADHFYLQVRPDPEVVTDVVYGPIEGNPVEKLDLADWLRESPGHPDPGYARRVARDMLRCGVASLARIAIAWIGGFDAPSPPDEDAELGAALDDFIAGFPQSPAIGEARALRDRLTAQREAAEVAWDAKRPKLPDGQYQPGVPYGDEHAAIVWGEATDAPLRLGIAGLEEGRVWRMGETLSFDLHVCNESPDPVRFAWTPRLDEGLSVALIAADGTVYSANIPSFTVPILHNRSALESAQVVKVKTGAIFTIGKPAGDGNVNHIPIEVAGPYTLRVSCHLGIRDWVDGDGTAHPRPAGEWEGTLQAKPVEVTFVAADAPAEPRHAETSSVLKKWREAYGEEGEIPAEAMTWLADKIDTFITQYPGEDAEKLKALLPDLKREQEWSWSDARAKLDAVADIATAPLGWLDLDESFRSFERVKPGDVWPEEKLADLPFGPAAENGLRVAWIFDPMRNEYRVGNVLKCRIIFHNSGREAVEFVTDQWHQEDTWHVTDPAGKEIPTKGTRFTGVTPYQRYKLEPGQTCEVAGHGVGIGVAEFAEATSQAQVGQQILAKPGDEVRCQWDVSIRAAWKQPDPAGETNPTTLPTGEVVFKVIAALPLGERPPGVAKSTGSFDLAQGIVLNVSQIGSDKGYENLAWITWDKDNGAGENGKVDLALPRNADPKDFAVPTFVWPRGGSSLWIVQPDKLRKIDFSTVGEAKETNWNWDEAPEDFGGAREDVREEIAKQRPPAKEQSYRDRPLSEWDVMLGLGGIRDRDREALTALGYGNADLAIPEAAIPMLLSLVRTGSPATKCRCLGTLRKLENPSDGVLDTVIAALGDEQSPGNRHRAGSLLGHFKGRSAYTVPRISALLTADGTVAQEAAVFALGQIGTNAQEALPALEALRANASEALALVIDKSIANIRGESVKAPPQGGIVIKVSDAETGMPMEKFRVVAGVPSGVSTEFEKTHGTTVMNWQSHTLCEGEDGAFTWPNQGYDEMALRIEADGYVPEMIPDLKKGATGVFPVEMSPDPGLRGSVQTPGNKRPAHDATVVLAMIRKNARLSNATLPEVVTNPEASTLRDKWDQPVVVTPDEKGHFFLPTEIDPTAVVLIVHGDGVYVKPYAEWRKAPDVILEPWARLHGQVQWGDKVGAGEKIDLTVNRGDEYGYPDIIAQNDSTTADEKGQFVIERVLPGLVQLSAPLDVTSEDGTTTKAYIEGRIIHAEAHAPHTPVMMGGRGRTVTGKLTGLENGEDVTFHFHPNAPHVGFSGDDTMWKAWSALQQSPSGPLFFRNGLKVAADGMFEIPGVLPGSYQIFFTREGEKQHLASGQFRVPKEERDEAPEFLDAGEFRVR